MTDYKLQQHGGRRPGAGRKPTLKPLALIRLIDPQIRADLVALTTHQRQASGNPQLSQEQMVADLIRAANQELENINNQHFVTTTSAQLAVTTEAIHTLRRKISDLLATLRTKKAVGQRDGTRLVSLLTELITLHATQIAPWAILEELDRVHADDHELSQAIATLYQRPLAEYRQDDWLATLNRIAAQLASGPIRRQADQWAFFTLAVEISSATIVTNDRIADLRERLQTKGIDPIPWLAQSVQQHTA
jgi:hypothetical protein